jgi:hypothetical protein
VLLLGEREGLDLQRGAGLLDGDGLGDRLALMADSSHVRAREHRRLARDAAMDEACRTDHKHGEEA